MKYWFFRLGVALGPHLPQQLMQRIALGIGFVLWAILPGQRRNVTNNLRHVPRLAANPQQLRRSVRKVFGNSLLNYVDFFRIRGVTADELSNYWQVTGLALIDEALAQGRGCVLFSGHLGNFDYAMRHFINLGYKITVTQEHLKPERLHQFVAQVRNVPGVRFAPVDSPSGLRELFGALRRNEVVIMPADRDIQGHGTLVQFFGEPARLPTGGVQLALRTGAGMVGVFPHRLGLSHGHGMVASLPELTTEEEAISPDPTQRTLRRVAKLLEQQIERSPEQWVIFAPVWAASSEVPPAANAAEHQAGVDSKEAHQATAREERAAHLTNS
jgi:KDO2-lipid IV(A) lauroyltransferase